MGLATDVLLASAGVVTTVPLVCFAMAVKRLRLTTVGVLSYVAPTLQFLLAVWVYGEPFGGAQLVACCFIWAALAVFTADNFARAARAPRVARGAGAEAAG
jgi:chloramphenicol-sensitive protein RarD